ncbi:MAG: TolC family protein [Rikenellaceae bacterium]
MTKLKLRGAAALALICCSLATEAYSQSNQLSMTLDECLEYAKLSSITLQEAKIEIENSSASELSARGAFLPAVTGVVGQDLNSNPLNMDPSASKSSYSGSYSVGLSMTLYNGGSNRYTLQDSKVCSDIANAELKEFENSIEVAVTQAYIEILYAMEQISVAENSLEVSRQNEARGRAFLKAGSINEVDLAQLVSATAQYQYELVVAKSQLSNLYVALKQLLEITNGATLSVKKPELSQSLLLAAIPSVEEVYATALESRPEIVASKLYVQSAELNERIAKSAYLPTLSLSASTGLTHNTSNAFAFNNQLRNNYNTAAGLNLSIPIFNGFQTRASVTQAVNDVRIASLSLTQAQKDLYLAIETLHNDAQTSQALYAVSELQLSATEKSMTLTKQQFEVGMKNTIELLTEQDNYRQASQTYLMNKYKLILNKALLNYYKTNIIKL